MNSNRILLITIGCGVVAVIIALTWKLTPETIDITTNCRVTERVTPASTSSDEHPSTELSPLTLPTLGDRSSTPPPDVKIVAPDAVAAPEQLWSKKYAGLDESQLRDRSKTLLSDLSKHSAPELQKLHDAGVYEVVNESNKYVLKPSDNDLSGVMSIVMLPVNSEHPSGETHRTVLPESRYPELWAMQDEYNWLRRRADELASHPADVAGADPTWSR